MPPSAEFQGLSAETRQFLARYHDTPQSRWTGASRAAYVTHVLAPLKSLCRALSDRLADVEPPIGFESRVGGSLVPVGEPAFVRRVRFWSADARPERSPTLFVDLERDGIRIGLAGRDGAALASETRALAWTDWIAEPGLADEIAEHLRELLPRFDALRVPVAS